MTGDELRAMIAEIEGRHGADVNFCVGRVWAMRDRFILARILENKLRCPESLKAKRDDKDKEDLARKEKMHDMRKSGMTHKRIGEEFGISAGRVGEILRGYTRWLRHQAIQEVS